MNFQAIRGFLNDNLLESESLKQLDSVALRFRNIVKAPQAIADKGINLVRKLPGANYIALRLKEAQGPKGLQCWRYDQVNEIHRETGILTGYRSDHCSLVQAVLSLFRITNETMNFWTHFLPSIYLMCLFYFLSSSIPIFIDPYFLPFVCYMCTTCLYPLMSSLAHAFSCISPAGTHVCFFMDYATLALYSWGCALLYYNYLFPTSMMRSHYASAFLPVAGFLAVTTTASACVSRFMRSTSLLTKALRLGSFLTPFLWVSAPIVWRLVTCEDLNDSCARSSIHHTRQFIGVFLAGFFYGTHIPERFAPGRFDFVGHSHNLLHIFGIAATVEQLKGSLIDMEERRNLLKALNWSSSPMWTLTVSPIIVILNIIIIISFARCISRDGKIKTPKIHTH